MQTEIWDKIWRKSRGNWKFCLEEEDVVNPWHQGKRMLKTISHTPLFRFLQKEKSEQMYKGSGACGEGGRLEILPEGGRRMSFCTSSCNPVPAHPCTPRTAPCVISCATSRTELRDNSLIISRAESCSPGWTDPATSSALRRASSDTESKSSGIMMRQTVKTNKNIVIAGHTLCDRSQEYLNSWRSFLLLLLWWLLFPLARFCCQFEIAPPPNAPSSFLGLSFQTLDTRCIRNSKCTALVGMSQPPRLRLLATGLVSKSSCDRAFMPADNDRNPSRNAKQNTPQNWSSHSSSSSSSMVPCCLTSKRKRSSRTEWCSRDKQGAAARIGGGIHISDLRQSLHRFVSAAIMEDMLRLHSVMIVTTSPAVCLRSREKILRQQQQQLSASTNVYCNNRFCIWSREMYRKCKQALFWLFSLSLDRRKHLLLIPLYLCLAFAFRNNSAL